MLRKKPASPSSRASRLAVPLLALTLTTAAATRTGGADVPPVLPEATVRVLIVGTFHFEDAGRDSYRPEYDVDVRSSQRQREIEDVVARLAKFAPTKVAVEWLSARQHETDLEYRRYLAGAFELGSNEVYQIGFRLAKRLGHTKVFLVDAKGRAFEPWVDPDQWAAAHGQERYLRRADTLWATYQAISQWEDREKTQVTIRETLLRLNDPERIRMSHGPYLIGNLAVGDDDTYPGVDSKTAWFNRNLRIFANLMRITEPNDRIVLIIGAGHLPILRQCVEASPEYRLEDVRDYLK